MVSKASANSLLSLGASERPCERNCCFCPLAAKTLQSVKQTRSSLLGGDLASSQSGFSGPASEWPSRASKTTTTTTRQKLVERPERCCRQYMTRQDKQAKRSERKWMRFLFKFDASRESSFCVGLKRSRACANKSRTSGGRGDRSIARATRSMG